MEIKFKKLVPEAKLPTQGKPGDAAFDLYSAEDVTLKPGETRAVSTGLQMADMPDNDEGDSIYIQFLGRSGVATKEGTFPVGGVLDATYRGELKVILHNGNPPELQFDERGFPYLSGKSVSFKKGDRVAQMAIIKIVTTDRKNQVRMAFTEEVTETARGTSGFGSTGQ